MQNNSDVKSSGDASVVTVPHTNDLQNGKATENTSLSPNNNQTYFVDEKVHVPDVEDVSYITLNVSSH